MNRSALLKNAVFNASAVVTITLSCWAIEPSPILVGVASALGGYLSGAWSYAKWPWLS